ncbi:MAG: hypothetical protein IJO00_02600 [Clostridia bacterium]|nr:hypothetical protein [Clostridia bacterium]
MKDSTKLFLASLGVVFCGFLKGVAPTSLGQSFDSPSFLGLCGVAVIVAILGLIKYLRGK